MSLGRDKIKRLLSCLALVALPLLTACGGEGEADKLACLICGTITDLRGSISTKAGSQAQMQGWIVSAYEFDTGIARVAEVDSAGLFTLSHIKIDTPQTLALLSPDYILQAVLSIPNDRDPKTIHQWVYFQNPTLPKLIYDSPIITFENLNGMSIHKKLASAQKGNGIPDGYTQILGTPAGLVDDQELDQASGHPVAKAAKGFSLTSVPDTNQDGIPNDKDPDIDGDGIINWLDQDENGNTVIDVFDPDANSDLQNDMQVQGHNTVQYFNQGVEYIAPQYEISPKDDNSTMQNSLKFVVKLRSDVSPPPLTIQIRGAPSLLNNATWSTKDSAGTVTSQAWDRRLLDDGVSEDGAAGDRIFGKKVILADGKAPRSNEVIFFELAFGTPSAPYYIDFPWIWPSVKPAAVTAQYDNNTKTVMLIGNPFGAIQDFVWNVTVFDTVKKTAVYASTATGGTVRQSVIPDNIIVAGTAYQFQVTAQSLDKVPGIPAFAIHSIKYDMK